MTSAERHSVQRLERVKVKRVFVLESVLDAVPSIISPMSTGLKVVGIILNIFLAGLGFILAPSGKKTRGWFWFGLWLIGTIALSVLLSPQSNSPALFWAVVVNIWSAVEFARISTP